MIADFYNPNSSSSCLCERYFSSFMANRLLSLLPPAKLYINPPFRKSQWHRLHSAHVKHTA